MQMIYLQIANRLNTVIEYTQFGPLVTVKYTIDSDAIGFTIKTL